jgi:hypothetical protein
MNLTHYSSRGALFPVSMDQDREPSMKPRGLWVSVDGEDDWPSWNEREQFLDLSLQTAYRVTLADDARLLHLTTPGDLHDFTERYLGNPSWTNGAQIVGDTASFCIDWARVASLYQGIVIAPYQWGCRYDRDLMWYAGYDCASGCIWDASAIESVALLPKEVTSG